MSEVTKLYSFVSAVKAWGHVKLNNRKISSVTFPEFFTIYLYMWDPNYIKKEKKIMESFFQNFGLSFGLSGYAENNIYTFWFQKRPKDGPSYSNATKILNIKSLCYQRINCETFFKLWSEKCKMLCYINHYILVTMVTKQTRWPPLFLLKFTSATLKEYLYQIWGKFMEWKLRDRITLKFSPASYIINTFCAFGPRIWFVFEYNGREYSEYISMSIATINPYLPNN